MSSGPENAVAAEYLSSAEGSDAARLRFMMGLWDLQASIEPRKTSFEALSAEDARDSIVTGQPLFAKRAPDFDRDEYLDAVSRIANYVAESAVLSAEQSVALRETDFSATSLVSEGSSGWQSPEAWIGQVAASVVSASDGKLTTATAVFVLHSALVPFLVEPSAEAMKALGDFDAQAWGSGNCPVCGAAAALGRVGESTRLQGAERGLWCASCHAEWGYERIRCVRCGCRSADKLRYTFVEGDSAHRLHLCDQCHGYARFIFEDELGKAVDMVVEDVVTAPLDAIAIQQGYTASGDGGSGSC